MQQKIIYQSIYFYRGIPLLTWFSQNLKMCDQLKILTYQSESVKYYFTHFHALNNRANVMVVVSLMMLKDKYLNKK